MLDRESLAALIFALRVAARKVAPLGADGDKSYDGLARDALHAADRFFAAAKKQPKSAKSKDDAKKASS